VRSGNGSKQSNQSIQTEKFDPVLGSQQNPRKGKFLKRTKKGPGTGEYNPKINNSHGLFLIPLEAGKNRKAYDTIPSIPSIVVLKGGDFSTQHQKGERGEVRSCRLQT